MAGKRYVVRLSEDERSMLTKMIRAEKKVSAKKRLRAQVLLKVDQGEQGPGWTDEQVARALDVHVNTVHAVRRELVEEGLRQHSAERNNGDRHESPCSMRKRNAH